MAFDEGLAERVRASIDDAGIAPIEEKRMFGGIAYMWNGNMLVGVVKDDLMVRVGPVLEKQALARPGARPMDFTKRPMKGFVFVGPEGTSEDEDLAAIVALAREYVGGLPAK